MTRRPTSEKTHLAYQFAIHFSLITHQSARVSTQLVLNRYNTNYEALGWLTDYISF